MTEDEMIGWHHQLNGHEFEQTLGDGEGQGSLACCSPWGRKESDTTEPLSNNRAGTKRRWASGQRQERRRHSQGRGPGGHQGHSQGRGAGRLKCLQGRPWTRQAQGHTGDPGAPHSEPHVPGHRPSHACAQSAAIGAGEPGHSVRAGGRCAPDGLNSRLHG